MKFLVMWEIDLGLLGAPVVQAVMRMPEYAKRIAGQQKLISRYHLVGRHGGAWLYDVSSNEELEHLLAMSPIYNFANFAVHPLADMESPAEVVRPLQSEKRPRRRSN